MTSRSQTANAFAIQADINSSNFAKKLKETMKITKADIDRICDNIGVGRVPGYEKADFWCRTSGDSMKPFISNGDIIALKEVKDWQSFLPMNEVYAVMTTNDLRTVKVVRRGADDEHFTLHAYNEEYEDQEINKAAITKVFKVLGALKTM